MSFPIDLLRCPITAQMMKPAPGDVVRSLQARQRAGELRTREGELAEPFEDGLLTADATWFFPIRSGIPVMLASEAIAMTEQRGQSHGDTPEVQRSRDSSESEL